MPRLKSRFTINITDHKTGDKYKIELCEVMFGKWQVRFNRNNSAKAKLVTLSEVCDRLRKLLVMMSKK